MLQIFYFSVFFILFFSIPQAWAEDCWISVSGAGLKNGKDAANAYAAADGPQYARQCWKQTGPEDTMHVMEGQYTVGNKAFWRLLITSKDDGSRGRNGKHKKIVGEGHVVLEGPRPVPYDASHKADGGTWIELTQSASRITIDNFQISRVADAIVATEGGNHDLKFIRLHFEDTRQNFHIRGHPSCKSRGHCRVSQNDISNSVLIQETSGLRYSKRHVRLGRGVFNVWVFDSHANADFLNGDFAVGFDVENPSHDIEFARCSSRGNVYTLSSYWNGDGFKSENETERIRWVDSSAFDNGDAGFDIKSPKPHLENIVALRNNRNIRIWSSQKGLVKNANASYSKHWGGEGTEAGLWSSGSVDCRFCTLSGNKIQIMAENSGEKKARIRIYDSILSKEDPIDEWVRRESGSSVRLIRTVQWQKDEKKDPQFGINANVHWEGGNQEFNSLRYGKWKGYHHD